MLIKQNECISRNYIFYPYCDTINVVSSFTWTHYGVDAEGSSQIILPTQNLERACQSDKESEAVLKYLQYDYMYRASEGSKIEVFKNAYGNV